MSLDSIITLTVISGAVILFATELLRIDIVALLIMVVLMLTGVLTPEQGIAGFSNTATITVAFYFILSGALLQTGALQTVALRLSAMFRHRFGFSMAMMMLLIAAISAFVNNTPIVAVFIPVVIQIAHASGRNPTQMLIPLSFASIMGGTCTLVGTSTNLLVSGISEDAGHGAFSMFDLAPIGLIMLAFGIAYMSLFGLKLLPNRKVEKDLSTRFGVRDYLMEIELHEAGGWTGKKIMDSSIVREMEMDIIEVRRNKNYFTLPPGDFRLATGDILKVRCDVNKIKQLKDKVRILDNSPVNVGGDDLRGRHSTMVELVIPSESDFEGKTLREVDFRRRYRAVPLAIRHRREVLRDHLYEVPLKAGDVVLAEVKSHYVKELKKQEGEPDFPFVLLSEDSILDFDRKKFWIVMSVIVCTVLAASFGLIHILAATMSGVTALVLLRVVSMKDAYESINWKIIFLLAGALALGTAMESTGLDRLVAGGLVDLLSGWGPIVVLSGLYLATSLLTEIMSNMATAALLAPIAIATSDKLGMEATPFLIAITIAASASFMTPVGYQTNTMVFSAGQYRFLDFTKVGTLLNLLFWVLATIFIPLLYFP